MNTHNLLHYFDSDLAFCIKSTIARLQQSMFVQQSVDLKNRCLEKQKLRTFITFKEFGTTPSYISMPMSFITRKFVALTRLSNLTIRLETGRFKRPPVPEHLRLCPACSDGISVESESHLIFQCSAYHELRQKWIRKLKIPENFNELEISLKLKIVLNESENVKFTGQFLVDAFNSRSKIVKK